MKISRNEKVKIALDSIAMSRSESDQDNYLILDVINHGTPVIQFSNCESFEAPPFNLCRNACDKRRMMASILTMGTARRITKFSANNVARNIDLVMNLYQYMQEFDASFIEEDPFLKNISLPLMHEEFVFGFHTYQKNRLFHFGTPIETQYRDILQLGYFREDVNYPYITRNGEYFDSISVHEMISSKNLIKLLSKNVLITGLKIGYLPYLAHCKESVEKVTIVEEDESIISLFEKEILPQFLHPEKIQIIHANTDSFLKESDLNYDCVLCDHYADSMHGVYEYVRIKELEKKHKKTKFIYALEDSILSNIKSALLIMCMAESSDQREELYHNLVENKEGEELILFLNPYFEEYQIENVNSLKKLFQNHFLKKHFGNAFRQ